MEQSIKRDLIEIGALTPISSTHFRLEPEAIYARPDQLWFLAETLAGAFFRRNIKAVVGTGPGFALAALVARELGRMSRSIVRAVYAMPVKGEVSLSIDEYYRPIVNNERVLIIDGIVTDTSQVRNLIAAVKAATGYPVGLGVVAETTPSFHDIFSTVSYRHSLLSAHQLGL